MSINPNLSSAILGEVLAAYRDCDILAPRSVAMNERNLHFLASSPVPRDEAIAIMRTAIGRNYNNFHADLLKLLPANAKVTLAREYSVCVYVGGKIRKNPRLEYSEFDYDPKSGMTRIWWD